eukprot:7776462-Lingulodinium_polyedra.AAC.1
MTRRASHAGTGHHEPRMERPPLEHCRCCQGGAWAHSGTQTSKSPDWDLVESKITLLCTAAASHAPRGARRQRPACGAPRASAAAGA